MPKTVTSTEAQNNFGAILQWADEHQDEVIVARRGTPRAVIISYSAYEKITRLRQIEEKRQALAKIRAVREKVQSYTTPADPAEAYRAAGFAEEVIRETRRVDEERVDAD